MNLFNDQREFKFYRSGFNDEMNIELVVVNDRSL